MSAEFARAHAALFDELERQGIYWADVVKLTQAVVQAQLVIANSELRQPYRRCANGACDG
jgi:hypothetical protein